MGKRALLVGINRYSHYGELLGCEKDVEALSPLIAVNADGAPNFSCRSLVGSRDQVARRDLIVQLDQLFAPGSDVALLYFAGHGRRVSKGVALVSSDGHDATPGVTLDEVIDRAASSTVPETIIILDCCFSGAAGGTWSLAQNVSALPSGMSILAASRADQTASETTAGRGVFSLYLCSALDGGAADVLGKVTVAGLYAFLSESFGEWGGQRPTFKANVDRLHQLRACSPVVPAAELRLLPKLFPAIDSAFALDRSFEPTEEPRHPENERTFRTLQSLRSARLVEPVGASHMYDAALGSQSCRLTPLGKHYWRLAEQGLL